MTKHDPEKVLLYIIEYKQTHDGCAPTLREIAQQLNIPSVSIVKNILVRLEGDGKIKRIPDKAGGIMVVGGSWEYVQPMRYYNG